MATIGTNIGRIEFVIYAINYNGVRDTYTSTKTLYLESLKEKSLDDHLDDESNTVYQTFRTQYGSAYADVQINAKVYLNGEPKMFCQQRISFSRSRRS